MPLLVTGAAGFIGFHLCKRLLDEGYEVVGLDNLNPYYSVELKKDRLNILSGYPGFYFSCLSLEDAQAMDELFQRYGFEKVVHLAAQAGVRYSLSHPRSYIDSNVVGFENVLECARHHQVHHLVYASSSSVYGLNTRMPFSVHDVASHPVSLYGATKRANELMAHCYSYLYGIPTTGLRFFTVYGPWGRPDMALFLFTRAILNDEPIQVFNYGKMKRDFTYIDDIIEGVYRVMDRIPTADAEWNSEQPDPATSLAPYRVFNIGNNNSVELEHFIRVLEECLGKRAQRTYMPLQPGDVPQTYADVEDLMQAVGYKPGTPVETGVSEFVTWYRSYYGV
jgi:UDP-glucuronate 4-epimerase